MDLSFNRMLQNSKFVSVVAAAPGLATIADTVTFIRNEEDSSHLYHPVEIIQMFQSAQCVKPRSRCLNSDRLFVSSGQRFSFWGFCETWLNALSRKLTNLFGYIFSLCLFLSHTLTRVCTYNVCFLKRAQQNVSLSTNTEKLAQQRLRAEELGTALNC